VTLSRLRVLNGARCLFQLGEYTRARQEYQFVARTYSSEESREALFWIAESSYLPPGI
jgi:hypothetical protein